MDWLKVREALTDAMWESAEIDPADIPADSVTEWNALIDKHLARLKDVLIRERWVELNNRPDSPGLYPPPPPRY